MPLQEGGGAVPLAAVAEQDATVGALDQHVAHGDLLGIAIVEAAVRIDGLHRKEGHVCVNSAQKRLRVAANEDGLVLGREHAARAIELDVVVREQAHHVNAVGDHGHAAHGGKQLGHEISTARAVHEDHVPGVHQAHGRLGDLLFLQAVLVTAQGEGNMLAAGVGDLDAAVAARNQASLLQIFQIPADAGGADAHFACQILHGHVFGLADDGEDLVLAFTFIHGPSSLNNEAPLLLRTRFFRVFARGGVWLYYSAFLRRCKGLLHFFAQCWRLLSEMASAREEKGKPCFVQKDEKREKMEIKCKI